MYKQLAIGLFVYLSNAQAMEQRVAPTLTQMLEACGKALTPLAPEERELVLQQLIDQLKVQIEIDSMFVSNFTNVPIEIKEYIILALQCHGLRETTAVIRKVLTTTKELYSLSKSRVFTARVVAQLSQAFGVDHVVAYLALGTPVACDWLREQVAANNAQVIDRAKTHFIQSATPVPLNGPSVPDKRCTPAQLYFLGQLLGLRLDTDTTDLLMCQNATHGNASGLKILLALPHYSTIIPWESFVTDRCAQEEPNVNPLLAAVQHRCKACVDVLLDHQQRMCRRIVENYCTHLLAQVDAKPYVVWQVVDFIDQEQGDELLEKLRKSTLVDLSDGYQTDVESDDQDAGGAPLHETTALWHALKTGEYEIAHLLLEHGAWINEHLFKLAITTGHRATIQLMLASVKIQTAHETESYKTDLAIQAIAHAILMLPEDLAEQVIQVGLARTDPYGLRCLMPTIRLKDILLDREVYSDSWSLLMYAAYRGSARLVRALLACGSDPGRLSQNGKTAYHIAQKRGFESVADLLKLQPGASFKPS